MAHKDCIKTMIRVRKGDYSGVLDEKPNHANVKTEQDAKDAAMESMECHLAYLKLINVPSMFDVGSGHSDPQSDLLTLSMIDNYTHKLVKKQFLGQELTKNDADLEKIRQQLQTIHTNMKVSKTVIDFTESNAIEVGGANAAITLTIDGERMFAEDRAKVTKIVVTRLKNHGEQVTVPIMTY